MASHPPPPPSRHLSVSYSNEEKMIATGKYNRKKERGKGEKRGETVMKKCKRKKCQISENMSKVNWS